MGRGEDEERSLDHVKWSCAHSSLTLTGREARRLVERYKMEVMIPQELCRAHKPPRGYVTASEMFLKFVVRFSLRQFFRDVLRFYGLIVFQVTPNG